jgi:ribosomal protein S3
MKTLFSKLLFKIPYFKKLLEERRSFERYFKDTMRSICFKYNFDYISWQIHSIQLMEENQKEIKCEILLGRPGLFIGKGGRTINSLENYLSEYHGRKVSFVIKEYDVWK